MVKVLTDQSLLRRFVQQVDHGCWAGADHIKVQLYVLLNRNRSRKYKNLHTIGSVEHDYLMLTGKEKKNLQEISKSYLGKDLMKQIYFQ